MVKKICFTVFSSLLLLVSTFVLFSKGQFVFAQTDPTPTPTTSASSTTSIVGECANNNISAADCPAYLSGKLSNLQGQANTLSNQIQVMDSQINLTQARIQATQQKIMDLTLNIDTASTKITTLEGSIDNLTKTLMNRIVATYEIGTQQPFQILVSSSDISDYFKRSNYLKIVQDHDKRLIYDTVQAKNDYANQKQIYEDEKKQVVALQTQLQAYTQELDQEKQQKQQLLSQTEGSESVYQSLLAQAEAQLSGFSHFVSSQGGATPLSNQTVCDGWGCYYNQRDTQWGSAALGGSSYSIADDGCLLTSMAMVYTHYSHRSVTPLSINGNPNNFASYNRAYLLKTISADGATSNRIGSDIDSELSAGRPVIVGISYDGGPIADHFVVFVSGSGGNYIMNDPFTPNGHNISFRGTYPTERIVEIDKVVF